MVWRGYSEFQRQTAGPGEFQRQTAGPGEFQRQTAGPGEFQRQTAGPGEFQRQTAVHEKYPRAQLVLSSIPPSDDPSLQQIVGASSKSTKVGFTAAVLNLRANNPGVSQMCVTCLFMRLLDDNKFPQDFEQTRDEFHQRIEDIVSENNIPDELVVNWDQT
ncbi:hypothetical protein Bbelb_425250 [Branchiostoma belcheri]|nr:hypothetical protein Bbelb_425250 [Branchiostoma belcheri]